MASSPEVNNKQGADEFLQFKRGGESCSLQSTDWTPPVSLGAVDKKSLIPLTRVVRQVLERYRPDLLLNDDARAICEKTLSDFLRQIDAPRFHLTQGVIQPIADLNFLRKINVLDLGCGSYDHESVKPELATETPLEWEPWLCRALHILGVKAIGVDYFLPSLKDSVPSTEDWAFQQLDLTNPTALSGFRENSFDVVNCHELIGVHLKDELFFDRQCFSPTLEKIAQNTSTGLKEIQENIFAQVLRILKGGGLFVLNAMLVYRKVCDEKSCRFESLGTQMGLDDRKNLAKPKTP